MAKNYMADVARMLGVGLDEEFKLDGRETKYKFTENGLYFYAPDGWRQCSSVLLPRILRGNVGIVKLPWQLKGGDEYYYPVCNFKDVSCTNWVYSIVDFAYKEAGFIFKTYEECEAALPELRKKYLEEVFRGR